MEFMNSFAGLDFDELDRTAKRLGHDELRIDHKAPPAEFPNGTHKYYAVCSCGYRSNMRATEAEAIRTLINHLVKIMEKEMREGRVSIPKNVGHAV